MAAQDYASLVQQLYVTYFGRPADYFGLQNFEAQLAALNAPTTLAELNAAVQADSTSALAVLVNSFSSSDESKALYGTDTSQVGISKFVEAIYVNLLGREPDVEGWAFWTNAITSGSLTLANAALAIADGALANTSAQGLLDAATVANKVTVATNFTAALDTVAEINAFSGDTAAATARGLLAAVDSTTDTTAYQSTVESTVSTILTGSNTSTNTTLTTAVDSVVGGTGNDIFNATVGNTTATNDTLNALDSINGGAGTDTLNILDVGTGGSFTGLPAGVTLTSIENVSIRSAEAINVTTAIAGVTSVAVTQATAVTALAVDSGSSVTVSGITAGGDIAVSGGTTQTITGTGSAIALDSASGAISVTSTSTAGKTIAVDDGSSVSISATGISANTATITVGAGGEPSGAVAISATGAAYTATTTPALGAITVTGGTKVTVVETATSDASAAAKDTSIGTIVEGAVSITGGEDTTEVSVQQTASVTGVSAHTNTAAYEKSVVTFSAIEAGETIIVAGLTFTAAQDLTAAEVAAAFANIAAAGVQGSAVTADGTYTGTLTDFASGAASGATVTFTSTTKADVTNIDVDNGTGAAPTVVTTAGAADATATKTGVLGVTAGAVTIADSGDAVLATVSLDGYGTASVTSDALTTLKLANSTAAVTVVNTAATTLGLTLNKVGTSTSVASVDLGSTYTTLNITTATADSALSLIAGGVTALTIAGTNVADLSGGSTDLGAVKTVVVSGSAGVVVDLSGSADLTSFNASATSGANTVELDATTATYTGGSGVDTVTLSAGVSKAITLGAGNDVLYLADGTTSLGATITGGDGTDTLVFTTATDAAAATVDTTFQAKVVGFEHLTITESDATKTVNLHNLNDISYVSVGTVDTGTTLTLDKVVANSTLVLTGDNDGTIVVTLADATGTSDVLNVVLTSDSDIAGGVIKAAGVETINLTATDTKVATINTATVDLVDAALKSLVITGNANVDLTAETANVKLASVNASALTGNLTATTNGTLAETITGGSGNDVLTAIGTNNKLIGGAGDDTLIVGDGTTKGNLTTLTGGAGNDTFDVSHATVNVNSYATITDFSVGDIIKFAAGGTFNSSEVTLGDTSVFQDYANAAIAATDAGDISWFQFGGNTYVIENVSNDTSAFVNGSDIIVKITGEVDLAGASFSTSAHTLVLVG